jgi:capsular polysaccharide transport system ATP-binding protein
MPSPSRSSLTTPATVIEVRRASKRLPAGVNEVKKAFTDLSLSVNHGHRLGLFSVNSYEAQTLLECLAGVDKPDKGEVLHHGSVSWPVGTNQAFHKQLSGYANARFAAEVYSQPGRIEADLQLIQELTGADDATFHEPMGAWPSQLKKALELAVSLAFQFDVMAVGKISNWDHQAIHPQSVRIRQLFEQRIEGRTLVMAAPGQNKFALDFCDEGLAIVEGRLLYRGDPEICLELVKEENQRLKYERRQRVNNRVARLLEEEAADDDRSDDDTGDDDTGGWDGGRGVA